jgi:hypothetical protein
MISVRKTKYVQKVVRIPVDDAEWFDENYPMYGAWSWLVQSTLSNFRALHDDGGPVETLLDAVKASAVQKASEASEEIEDAPSHHDAD